MNGIQFLFGLIICCSATVLSQTFDIPRVQPLTEEQKLRRQEKHFRVSPYSVRRSFARNLGNKAEESDETGTDADQLQQVNVLPKYFATSSTEQLQRFQRLDSDAVISGRKISDAPFPVFLTIPQVTFSCGNRLPGFYADQSAGCQVYHQCLFDGRRYTHLCGVGTIFNQEHLVCDHWYNYDCSKAEIDSRVNERYQRFFTTEVPTQQG
ncbi:uncharacterized protein LOC136031954 [Artemia franciscana]|uniref:Chitin-binding type-2 domain-containing protein n=1 Tax=Artemia franciscana TaxID=6661 RepID=A0AA88ID64_ARTSF|nr:hypothetical protein QYM36_000760 [Artemia franciscana]